jgi:hypothetical protein
MYVRQSITIVTIWLRLLTRRTIQTQDNILLEGATQNHKICSKELHCELLIGKAILKWTQR